MNLKFSVFVVLALVVVGVVVYFLPVLLPLPDGDGCVDCDVNGDVNNGVNGDVNGDVNNGVEPVDFNTFSLEDCVKYCKARGFDTFNRYEVHNFCECIRGPVCDYVVLPSGVVEMLCSDANFFCVDIVDANTVRIVGDVECQ